MNEKNILISATAHLGDFIWATSAIALLKKTHPDVKITVLAPHSARQLIEGNSVIDAVLYCPYWLNNNKSRFVKLLWGLKTSISVRFKRFDAIFILDSSRASVLIARLAGIKKIIGGDLFWAGFDKPDPIAKRYTIQIKMPKDQDRQHVSLRYQTLIKSYFGIYNNALPIIPDSSKHKENAEKLLGAAKSGARVILSVTALRDSTHIWDLANFKKVIDLIEARLPAISFFLIGVAECFEESQKLVFKDNIFNLCGKTSILELREIFKMSDLLISMDTGVIHIAATTKLDIISLHGATSPLNTGPLTPHSTVFYRETDCALCKYRTLFEGFSCPTYPLPKCLAAISPQEVAAKAILKLQKNKSYE
ncbi:MAG: glycosyltransferase family 9 protein [Elusimicrobiota bacterium]|jgi:ADP-heptose:LPS heptosyltransferase|nr:glycosyltransferase family 9 protein [Elusimicrobiota bacterium]